MIGTASSAPTPDVPVRSVEVSTHGKWKNVPAVEISGQTIVVRGKWIRIASMHDEDWLTASVIDPAECIRALKDRRTGVRADIFYFSQKEPDTVPRYNYPLEMRSLAVAKVDSFDAWWKKISHGTKCNIRQAKKRSVEVNVRQFDDELVRGIMSVQNESPIRQGRRFYHYGKSFDQVKRDHGSYLNTCDFICAYHGEELLGFLKLVYRGDVALIMQLNSKLKRQSLRPTNAMLVKAAEVCASKGIRYLVYGEYNYWNKRECSLLDFKARNGFEEMLVPSYYVPITAWGWLLVKARLYRGPLGILPMRLIGPALALRRKWHGLFAKMSRTIPAIYTEIPHSKDSIASDV